MTFELPAVQVGQRWQCRDQTYYAKISHVTDYAITADIYGPNHAYRWARVQVTRVVNKNEAAYRTKSDRRNPHDLLVLLFPVD